MLGLSLLKDRSSHPEAMSRAVARRTSVASHQGPQLCHFGNSRVHSCFVKEASVILA